MIHSTRGTGAKFSWLVLLASVLATAIALSSPAAAQTASDSTFLDADWALTQFTTPGGGTSTATQSLSGAIRAPFGTSPMP